MNNQPNTQPKDFNASKCVMLTGSWKSMILPFIGILLINTILTIFAGSFVLMKIFSDRLESKGQGVVVIAILFVLVLGAWVFTYLFYFPKKWKTRVEIDFEKQLISIQSPTGEHAYQFSDIENIRYKAATSLFNTSFLYFISNTDEKEMPMVALSDAAMSTSLFHMLKQRAKLNVVQ